MCVIIERRPNVTIPADMIEQACDINKHGFGIVFAKGGSLITEYSIQTPNDPKVVADRLQALKGEHILLHLRHATVGDISRQNLHPIPVLHKKKHGLDLVLLHNGTLWDYRPKDDKDTLSDTNNFNNRFLRPMAVRFNAFDKKKMLSDQLFLYILQKEIGMASVVVLIDGAGNIVKLNDKQGKDYEGWWASNTYSFSSSHQRSSKRTFDDYSYQGWSPGDPWDKDVFEDTSFAQSVSNTQDNSVFTTWEQELRDHDNKAAEKTKQGTLEREYGCVNELITKAKQHKGSIMAASNIASTLRELKVLKTPFIELANIKSLDEVIKLSENDLVELSNNWPGATARLIVDLILERAKLTADNSRQAERILALTAPVRQ